jgi:SAM-dependent methyltransferase
MTSQEIRDGIASFPRWHYEFDLDGARTPAPWPIASRHRERKRYFFDPLVSVCGGSLSGKRVLDLACNAGFFSLCAIESGCDFVLGVDARRMHIDQANFVFEVKGVDKNRYEFVEGNVFDVDLSSWGPFDIVLCLGLLYHIGKPVSLMEKIASCNTDLLVIDASLSRAPGSYLKLHHERTDHPLSAFDHELVTYPTKQAVVDIAAEVGYSVAVLKPRFTSYVRSQNYRTGFRRAFLCAKRTSLSAGSLEIETLGRWMSTKDAVAWAYSESNRVLRTNRVLRRVLRRGPLPRPISPGLYSWSLRARLDRARRKASRRWKRVSKRVHAGRPRG